MIPTMTTVTADLCPLRIAFAAEQAGVFDPGLPVLAGESLEELFGPARPAGRMGALTLYQTADWLLGAASVPLDPGLEDAAHQLYRDIFLATRGWHLARIWNYVPDINQTGPSGLENYRLFCRGRSLAFEEEHGAGCKARMPSASAVGCKSASLTVAFAAGRTQPRHHENPLQVPAYNYPVEYGPRAPSFARATVVPGSDWSTVFVSGTAAIRGHAIVAAQSVNRQLECTLENLREISRVCGLGPKLDRGGRSRRHFKIYVRHASDQPAVAATLGAGFLTDADKVSYLEADICRASLLVEIEASLFGVGGLH
jgi:hypothetical protein